MRGPSPVLGQLLRPRGRRDDRQRRSRAIPGAPLRARAARRDNGSELPAYRLTGQERRGLGLWGRMTRFVGRASDLEALQSRLALAGGGHGQVVAVVGEAGVGKSRLIYEFSAAQRL